MKNQKKCIMCGAIFYAPPSSKKITCSKKCLCARRSAVLTGRIRSEQERNALSRAAIERGKPKSYNAFILANQSSPKCQRGEMHNAAKKWKIKNIDTGEEFAFTNLSQWVRNNINRFMRLSDDIDTDVNRISHGFYTIKKNFIKGNNCITYYGWQIIDFDDRKNCERNYKL